MHVHVQGSVIPCIYALLPNKTEETYRRFWAGIEQHLHLQPHSVMSDFELASVNAMRNAFPDAVISGCFFHIGQSLWRHVQNSGLRELYIQNEETRTKIKSLLSLAFLPPAEVTTAFEDLIETFPENLTPIADYFENIYIGRRGRRARRTATFPIAMWNMHGRVLDDLPRTNNAVEAWHRSFQGALGCHHPTIWKAIAAFQRECNLQSMVLAQTLAGSRPMPQAKKYKRVNSSLKTLIERQPETPVIDFLRGCSYHLEMNV